MSSDIYEKSWVELLEEDKEEESQKFEYEEGDEEMSVKTVDTKEEPSKKSTFHNTNPSQSIVTVKDSQQKSVCQPQSQISASGSVNNVQQEKDNDIISKFIKEERDIKVQEEVLRKYIKEEGENAYDDEDDMFLYMNKSPEREVKKPDQVKVSKEAEKAASKAKTEIKTEVDIDGAEDEWAAFVDSAEEPNVPKRLTFAEICAKNASPSPVQSSMGKSEVSLIKKQRKRSLFPEDKGECKKDVFGVLDENSVDSPSKDLRRIMNNIHMDSPLKSDSENVERVSSRKKAVAVRRDLMEEPSQTVCLRKRPRDTTKTSESPASKMAHYSDDTEASKESPVRKKVFETDKSTLFRRQKQIDYGKNTKGYDNYLQMVPKEKREALHPKTPPKHLMYSRRAWDGLIKVWRQKLHFWDSPADGGSGGIGDLPESWETLSEASLSASCGDCEDMSDKSLPSTPQADKKRLRRKTSVDSVKSEH